MIFHFPIIYRICQKYCGKHGQHAKCRKDQKSRHHQGSKHSMTANHQHKQNRIPCDCHSKTQVEHTDTAHKLPQQRKQYHHGQNLYRSAKCTKKCIAVIPALPTHIILEKIQQQIGRNIQRAVNQYNGDDNRHCLIVVNQRRKHLPYGRRFHMNRGFFPDRQTGDRNKQHKQYRNNKCKPAETRALISLSQHIHTFHRNNRNESGTDTRTGTRHSC